MEFPRAERIPRGDYRSARQRVKLEQGRESGPQLRRQSPAWWIGAHSSSIFLLLVLVLDLSFFVYPEEARRRTGIDYENEDEDEDDWEARQSP
jgi:hypothetical protein